jgi:hypothetical protein
MYRKSFIIFLTTLLPLLTLELPAMAQRDMEKTDQAGLRADGKIWVVMAVCLTILAGILFYLYSLDKKIKRLEQKENS